MGLKVLKIIKDSQRAFVYVDYAYWYIKKFFFNLKDNCFTMLCWFLPYINMNQPYVPSLLNLPLTSQIFPGGSDGKASAYNVGDLGSIPELGRSSGEEDGNPLQ